MVRGRRMRHNRRPRPRRAVDRAGRRARPGSHSGRHPPGRQPPAERLIRCIASIDPTTCTTATAAGLGVIQADPGDDERALIAFTALLGGLIGLDVVLGLLGWDTGRFPLGLSLR